MRARKIDIIVVYKVDRLTRSLADFAKLVELFDAHDVSFVSVTQSFNTTSSMGRLTLNVLLSFAQFEREVIGERVRDKIAASKRRLARSPTPAILTGLIFDDRGNPMTPSHASKKGVRYRYYVSHALLQGRKSAAGSIARVSAPDMESLVIEAVREQFPSDLENSDHDLFRKHVRRIVVHRQLLEIFTGSDDPNQLTRLTTPFIPNGPRRKGITSSPSGHEFIDAETRDILLKAISRSHLWMRSILDGKMASFDEVAAAENLGERYVRRLAVLAYLSPKIIQAIADGVAPNGMTVSGLTVALPHAWAEQEAMLGLN